MSMYVHMQYVALVITISACTSRTLLLMQIALLFHLPCRKIYIIIIYTFLSSSSSLLQQECPKGKHLPEWYQKSI